MPFGPWPPGVAPAACPNFPFCATDGVNFGTGIRYADIPVAPRAREWPAGVNPAEFPNFPN